MKNIKELCEGIWRLEKEFDLLDMEIQGVKVWQYIRMPIYYDIAERVGILQKPHAKKTTLFVRLKRLHAFLRSILLFNPLFVSRRHIEEIVIDHPRFKCIDGDCIDIYTYYYLSYINYSNI